MSIEFVILHVLIMLGAASCLYLAVREGQGWPMRPLRLFAPALLASLTALVLWHLAASDPLLRLFGYGALVVGLIAGAARGSTIAMQVDHVWGLVRLPRARDTFWIAVVLAAAVAQEIAVDMTGTSFLPHHVLPAALAALCAGMLGGRALAAKSRVSRAPETNLHGQ